MKTSLNELQLMEDCLLQQASGEQYMLFEAKLLLDPKLQDEVNWQYKTYHIIHEYGRQQIRHELEQVHQLLFTTSVHQSFRKRILGLFHK
ncbi:hypothetical protein [Parapedobacter tibetensis]|uniref:hypothetical protein n=1 Tax=Parapedobacter tibetensis TaxID=2972951 RepID=UPI00214D5084|nr:hypothetical protein [Parapedobacter tibetensis]